MTEKVNPVVVQFRELLRKTPCESDGTRFDNAVAELLFAHGLITSEIRDRAKNDATLTFKLLEEHKLIVNFI